VLAKAGVWQPDLVLLDADLAGPDHENAVNDIKLRARETKVVLIVRHTGATVPGAMVATQADGCVELHRVAHQLPLLVQSLFGPAQNRRRPLASVSAIAGEEAALARISHEGAR
jgi:DNA-binding NarL/FixJ family response regulator